MKLSSEKFSQLTCTSQQLKKALFQIMNFLTVLRRQSQIQGKYDNVCRNVLHVSNRYGKTHQTKAVYFGLNLRQALCRA